MFAELFRCLSPTLGDIEAFGEGVSGCLVEALVLFLAQEIHKSEFVPTSLRPSNLKYLRLAGVDLVGHAGGRHGHTFISFAKVPCREPWRCETKARCWKVEEIWNILL